MFKQIISLEETILQRVFLLLVSYEYFDANILKFVIYTDKR